MDIKEIIIEALGKRSAGIKGEAKNAKKLFSELQKLLTDRGIKLVDLLKSNDPIRDFPILAESVSEIKELLFDEKIGLKDDREKEKFRAKINLKSDPDAVVAGNDTACCMPFGSGKNNVYSFNPICALFTVQRQNTDGEWRTVAQSVLTRNRDIGRNVEEVVSDLKKPDVKMNDVVDESILVDQPGLLTCDNVEVARNFKNRNDTEKIMLAIYGDFFREYMARFAQADGLDEKRIIIGQGFTDVLTHIDKIDNTFIPEAPVGYSDNLHRQAYELKLAGEKFGLPGLRKKVTVKEMPEARQTEFAYHHGVSELSFRDSLAVAYIEGKAYEKNQSLIQYLHNMENALIAKDVNNQAKNRQNLSLKYTDREGKIHGYMLAYEGRIEKDGESCLYVADLATDGTERAGGSLMLNFAEMYKRLYIDRGKFIPITASLRETTSYPLIVKHLERLTRDTGLHFTIEEQDPYETGGETMHPVVIRPEKK